MFWLEGGKVAALATKCPSIKPLVDQLERIRSRLIDEHSLKKPPSASELASCIDPAPTSTTVQTVSEVRIVAENFCGELLAFLDRDAVSRFLVLPREARRGTGATNDCFNTLRYLVKQKKLRIATSTERNSPIPCIKDKETQISVFKMLIQRRDAHPLKTAPRDDVLSKAVLACCTALELDEFVKFDERVCCRGWPLVTPRHCACV